MTRPYDIFRPHPEADAMWRCIAALVRDVLGSARDLVHCRLVVEGRRYRRTASGAWEDFVQNRTAPFGRCDCGMPLTMDEWDNRVDGRDIFCNECMHEIEHPLGRR